MTQLSNIEGPLSDIHLAPCPNCSAGVAHMIHGDHDWVIVVTFQRPAGEKAPLLIRSSDDEMIEQRAKYEASAGISIQHAMEFGFGGNTEAETVGIGEDDEIGLPEQKSETLSQRASKTS